eukprot:1193121-Karenia_brevis.AAC.1
MEANPRELYNNPRPIHARTTHGIASSVQNRAQISSKIAKNCNIYNTLRLLVAGVNFDASLSVQPV